MAKAPNPHDTDAENALIGTLLATPGIVADVAAQVTPGDFYQPVAGAVFAAMVEAHRQGDDLAPAAVPAALRTAGWEPDNVWLVRCMELGDGSWQRHCRTVLDHRVRRQLIAHTRATLDQAADPAADISDVLDAHRAGLETIHLPDGTPPADLHELDTFIDTHDAKPADWLVPGMIRPGWRVVIVAGEGRGKSVLVRQCAVLAAQGIHPLAFSPMPPARTLLVDLENPPEAIVESCTKVRAQARQTAGYETGRAWLWHRPAGINLRTRQHQAEFASVLAATRPQLVCLGPLYKAYARTGRDTDEQATAEVQRVLDDLRTRFGFALMLEHHAPQDNAGFRTMRPYGSSLWLRWPEIGIGMEPHPDNSTVMKLTRWRGDRMQSAWPQRLERGQRWPWMGAWDQAHAIAS